MLDVEEPDCALLPDVIEQDPEAECTDLRRQLLSMRKSQNMTKFQHDRALAALQRDIDDLHAERVAWLAEQAKLQVALEVSQKQVRHWDYTHIQSFNGADTKALLGFLPEDYEAFLDQLNGAARLWKHGQTCDWKTGYTIAQLKLRQNIIYVLLEKLFGVSKPSCARIFRSFGKYVLPSPFLHFECQQTDQGQLAP